MTPRRRRALRPIRRRPQSPTCLSRTTSSINGSRRRGRVVLTHFFLALPGSREKLSFDVLLGLFFLAVLANVCYCAAYLADLFVQFSGLQEAWRRGRLVLLIVGIAFAATITHFFAKGFWGV